jgi:hypothetical protein
MEIKRYAFPSEAKAEELILELITDDSQLTFKEIRVSDYSLGVVVLGFENVYDYDAETDTHILIKESFTYDVDVVWKNEQLNSWIEHEVIPNTPNHNFL